VRTADVRALGPGEAQPAKILERRGGKFLATAGAVEVFDPHHEPGGARPLRGQGERPRMAHVEQPRGRRRQPAPQPRHQSHQLPVHTTKMPSARFVAAWARMQSIGFRVAAAIPLTIANQPTAATASAGWVRAA